jgi:hypothetical protein
MSEAAPLSFGEGLGVRSNKQITKSSKKLKKRIRKCEALIDNLKTLPYYTVFKLHGQQQKDIAKAEKKLSSLQSQFAVAVCSRSLQYSAV